MMMMSCLNNLGTGQACPGEHGDHDVHHHEMDSHSSVFLGDDELQQRPQPVFGVLSEDLLRRCKDFNAGPGTLLSI